MMPPPGKRATDRKGWPKKDRLRYQMYRAGRLLYVVVPIVLVVWIVLGDAQDTNRDEARKYQACTQRVGQNSVLRDSLLSAQKTQLQQAARAGDGVLADRFTVAARLNGRRAAALEIPDCRKTYPRGFEHSRDYPDLVPTAPPADGGAL